MFYLLKKKKNQLAVWHHCWWDFTFQEIANWLDTILEIRRKKLFHRVTEYFIVLLSLRSTNSPVWYKVALFYPGLEQGSASLELFIINMSDLLWPFVKVAKMSQCCVRKKEQGVCFLFWSYIWPKTVWVTFFMTFSPELQVTVRSKQSKGPVTVSIGGSLVTYKLHAVPEFLWIFGVTSGSDQNRRWANFYCLATLPQTSGFSC